MKGNQLTIDNEKIKEDGNGKVKNTENIEEFYIRGVIKREENESENLKERQKFIGKALLYLLVLLPIVYLMSIHFTVKISFTVLVGTFAIVYGKMRFNLKETIDNTTFINDFIKNFTKNKDSE